MAKQARSPLEGMLKDIKVRLFVALSTSPGKARRRLVAERRDRIVYIRLRRQLSEIDVRLKAVSDAKSSDRDRFLQIASFLDLILEPKTADEVIGDMYEQYLPRLRLQEGHAARWLYAQALWISLDRGFELLRKARAAWKAGG